jgi:hypothetical protein
MASEYGTLRIPVTADTRPLTTQVASAATTAGTKAGEQLSGNMAKGLKRFAPVAGQIGRGVATGLGIATTAAVAFGVEAFKAGAKVEATNKSLQALAKANNVSYRSMQDSIEGIRHMGVETGIAQDLVARLTTAHVGLAHATDLARIAQNASAVSGKSVGDTEVALAKAIGSGNAGALKRAGIMVDSKTALDKYAASVGKTAADLTPLEKSQAVLNGVLDQGRRYAGAYAAQLKTPQGALRALKIDAEEATQSIGLKLVHALTPAFVGVGKLAHSFADAVGPGGKLAPIVNAIGSLAARMVGPVSALFSRLGAGIDKIKPSTVQAIADAIKRFGPALAAAGAGAALFTGAGLLHELPVIGPMLNSLLGPILKLGPALMNLAGPWKFVIAGFALLMAVSPPFREEVMKIVRLLIAGLAPAFIEMGKSLLVLVPIMVDLAKAIGPVLAVALQATLPLIEAFTALVRFLAPALGPIAAAILAIVAAVKVWAAIQAILDIELSPFTVIIVGLIAVVAGLGLVVYEVIKHWRFFAAVITGIARSVFSFLNTTWAGIRIAVTAVWRWVVAFTTAEWRGWAIIIRTVVGAVSGFLSHAWDTIRNALGAVWRWVSQQTRAVWTGWGIIIRGAVGGVARFLSGAWDTIKNALGAAWRWITRQTTTVWRGWGIIIRDAVGAVVGIVTNGFNSIRGAIGGALTRATRTITGWASSLTALGRSAITNLLSGISSAIAGIGGWIKSHVVDPVVNAVKHWFGIHSPSSVMAEVGHNVTAGFIEGIVSANPISIAKKVFGGLPAALGGLLGKGLVAIEALPGKAISALASLGGKLGGILGKVGGFFGGLFGGGGSPGVAHWSGLVSAVLSMLGLPAAYLGPWLTQMNTESGGNPNAINLTDSNAQAGHPSQGLLQTIPSTFAAYAGPFARRGITDPLANIYAAINYALHRYGRAGMLGVIGHGHGYARGGILREPVMGFGLNSGAPYAFGENAPRVPEAWSPLRGPAPQLGGGARAYVINVYPQRGQSETEIAAAVSRRLNWAEATGMA